MKTLCTSVLLACTMHLQAQGDGICPDFTWWGSSSPGFFTFIIVDIEDGENVTWNFGDGIEIVGGALASHLFSIGSYTVTATFEDFDCNEEGTTTLTFNILDSWFDCVFDITYEQIDNCGLIQFALDQPILATDATWSFGDGLSTNSVEPITYQFANTGIYEVCANINHPSCASEDDSCIELEISDCEIDCQVATLTITSLGSSTVDTYIATAPNSQLYFTAEFNEVFQEVAMDFCLTAECIYIATYPDEPILGYEISVDIDDVPVDIEYNMLCDQGQLCAIVCVEDTNSICPDSIITTQLSDNTFQFFIEGIDEGQSVTWNFGDGNEVVDDFQIEHEFAEGTFLVSAIFMDADCPWDGPTVLSTEVTVVDCPSELIVEVLSCQSAFLTVPELEPNTLLQFDVNDEFTLNASSSYALFIQDEGSYEVCATNDSLQSIGCTPVCTTVNLEACDTPCGFPAETFSICNMHTYGFFEIGVDSIAVYMDGQFVTYSTVAEGEVTCNNVTVYVLTEGLHELCFESFANGFPGCFFCIYVEYVDCVDEDCVIDLGLVEQTCNSVTFQFLNPQVEQFGFYVTLNDSLLFPFPLDSPFSDTTMTLPLIPGPNVFCFIGINYDSDCYGSWCTTVEGCETVCPDTIQWEDGECYLYVPGFDGVEMNLSVNGELWLEEEIPIDLWYLGLGEFELCVWNDSLQNLGCPTLCTNVVSEQCWWSVSENDEYQILIFPNPASDQLTITLDENPGQPEAKLFESTGRIVLTQSISARTTLIDVSRLASGLYLLKFNGDSINETRQVEIVR